MQNEELATRIQAGERDLIPQLWEQVRGLILMLLLRLMNKAENRARAAERGVDMEDLEQEGYFALLDAVQAYTDKDGYKFSAYLKYPIMNRFFNAVGLRTNKQRSDPLSRSSSLNEPAGGEDESTERIDFIEDPAAAAQLEEVTERIQGEQLHAVLDDCMHQLTSNQERVLRGRYYENLSLADLSKICDLSRERIRQVEQKALRRLRCGEARRRLEAFREDIITCHTFYGSLTSFRDSGASSVERTVEKLDELEAREFQKLVSEVWGSAV